jgi:hypothetical protein
MLSITRDVKDTDNKIATLQARIEAFKRREEKSRRRINTIQKVTLQNNKSMKNFETEKKTKQDY